MDTFYSTHQETRYQLFVLRPTQRVSWIGYALSQHLAKDHDMALSILETFRETLTKDSADYEQSELMLYQAMVIRESGRLSEALDHLDKYESQICDKVTVQEMKGKCATNDSEHLHVSDATQGLLRLVSRPCGAFFFLYLRS